MKKLVFLLIFLFSFAAKAEEQFINPVFYQPLEPLSRTTGWTYLTPTSIEFRTPLDKNLIDSIGICNLIENTQNRITFLCDFQWFNKTHHIYFTYVIKDLFMLNCLRILEYSYYNKNDFIENETDAEKYCTQPLSKSD